MIWGYPYFWKHPFYPWMVNLSFFVACTEKTPRLAMFLAEHALLFRAYPATCQKKVDAGSPTLILGFLGILKLGFVLLALFHH